MWIEINNNLINLQNINTIICDQDRGMFLIKFYTTFKSQEAWLVVYENVDERDSHYKKIKNILGIKNETM
jgi:hypothetical protein